jgi:hypothetical protein
MPFGAIFTCVRVLLIVSFSSTLVFVAC